MKDAWRRVREVLQSGVGDAYPGAVLCVASGDPADGVTPGAIRFHEAVGHRTLLPEPADASTDTRYDLASLTKPAVAAVVADAVAAGRIGLDEPIGSLLPDARAPHWRAITVEHLVGHTSGLPPHRDFSDRSAGDLRAAVLREPPVEPAGTRAIYSDIGYMALGFCLEERLGASLGRLVEAAAGRLGATLTYRPTLPGPNVAPTELCPRRGLIHAEVHDPNAWALGGVAGHAGLFGTALDVARFAAGLLAHHRAGDPLGRVLDRMWYAPSLARAPTSWRLGWDSPTPGASSAGTLVGPRALGHLGFTGTSVWMDPDTQHVIVLLSNRVHPAVEPDPPIKRLRPLLHDAVFTALRHS